MHQSRPYQPSHDVLLHDPIALALVRAGATEEQAAEAYRRRCAALDALLLQHLQHALPPLVLVLPEGTPLEQPDQGCAATPRS